MNEKQIIKDYKKEKKNYVLYKHNISSRMLYKILYKNNIKLKGHKKKNKRIFSFKEEKEIIKDYLTFPITYLKNKYTIGSSTIYALLKRHKVSRKGYKNNKIPLEFREIIRDYKEHPVNYVLNKYNLTTYMLYKIVGNQKKKGCAYTWNHSTKKKYLPLFKKYKDQRKTKKWIISNLGISEKTYIYLYNLYNKQRKI